MIKVLQCVVLYLVTLTAISQDAPPLSEMDQFISRTRGVITAEVATLDKDHWAGHYYMGDGLGLNVSLDLAPTVGFVYQHTGCLGVYGWNYGSVAVENNHIHLNKVLGNDEAGINIFPADLLIIEWGKRKYLIAENELTRFANAINAGMEPRKDSHGVVLLKGDDYTINVEGLPELPDPYDQYLLKKPIRAKIIKVGESTLKPLYDEEVYRETLVKLNVGKKDGVFPGMELHAYRPKEALSTAEVRNISEKSCEALVTEYDEGKPGPEVGWRYSTHLEE